MTKAATIFGFGPSTVNQRMDAIEGSELWTMNNPWCHFPDPVKWSRLFQIHDHKLWQKDTQAMKDLSRRGTTIITKNDNTNLFEHNEVYPIGDVLAISKFLIGTATFMLAYAVINNYSKIRVYGIDQADFFHKVQRQSWCFWLGVARGRGIKIDGVLPVFDVPVYSYSDELADYRNETYQNFVYDQNLQGFPFKKTLTKALKFYHKTFGL
jgi:hypothetical protein